MAQFKAIRAIEDKDEISVILRRTRRNGAGQSVLDLVRRKPFFTQVSLSKDSNQ